MKLLVIFIIYTISHGFSQSQIPKDNILKMYDELSVLDDDHSLGVLNNTIEELSQQGKITVDKDLKQKYLQTKQYLLTKDKLGDCLKESGQELTMNLDKAILGMLNRDIYKRDLETLLGNCERLNDVSKSLKDFENILHTFKPDEQYKYYSLVQEQLYKKAMGNAMRTYADLARYEFEGSPDLWKEHLEKELKKNFCKPVSINIEKVDVPSDSPIRPINWGQAEVICHSLVKNISEEFHKRERIPLDKAADYFDKMVDRLDTKMTEAMKSHNDRDYQSYVATYQAILSRSPGTLLLTETLQDSEKGIGALVSKEDLYQKEYSVFHKKLESKDDKHLVTLKSALKEAKEKTKEGIEKIHQDFYQRDQDDSDAKSFFHLYGKIQKSRRKSGIEDIVRYYPSAAAQMLADDPFHVYAVCEAIISAEKSKKNKETVDKVVMWGGIVVGGALMVTGVGSAIGAGIYGASATVGGLSFAAIGTTAASIGVTTGLLDATYSAATALESYNEYRHHETALYANNSGDIKALDESYNAYKSALIFAGVNIGFSAIDLGALKHISKLKPKQILKVSEDLKALTPQSNIEDVKKLITPNQGPKLAKQSKNTPHNIAQKLNEPEIINNHFELESFGNTFPSDVEAYELLVHLNSSPAVTKIAPNLKGATNTNHSTIEMLTKYIGEENGDYFGTKVLRFPPRVKNSLQVYVDKSGKLVNHAGKPWNIDHGIFTMDKMGNITIFPSGVVGRVHHSSLAGAKPVSSAGHMTIVDGKLTKINNQSGHYQPDGEHLNQVLEELKSRGTDLKTTNSYNVGN